MTQPSRYLRILLFRRRGHSNQVLRVLEDADGWFYVAKLAGPDHGPYLKAELVSAFELEDEPCAARDLEPDLPGGESPGKRKRSSRPKPAPRKR